MLTNYSSNQILSNLCGKSSNISLGANSYVGLSTTTPSADGTNFTEPTGNGYARVLLGASGQSYAQKMGTATAGAITNTEIIYYPEATGSWGTITYFGIFSAQSGGQLLAYGALTTSIAPTANTIPIIRAGELDISLA
jgi:hypothetical protein